MASGTHARTLYDLGKRAIDLAGASAGLTLGRHRPGPRRHVILNTTATVDHDNNLGDHCHLSPGVHTGGTVTVGEGAHLGVGVAVRPSLSIGAWSVVGVGAAVVADIPDHVVAYGVPARQSRRSDRG